MITSLGLKTMSLWYLGLWGNFSPLQMFLGFGQYFLGHDRVWQREAGDLTSEAPSALLQLEAPPPWRLCYWIVVTGLADPYTELQASPNNFVLSTRSMHHELV